MNEISITSERDAPQFNPIKLLEQLSKSRANGYLQVIYNSVGWKIYLARGKLIYATHCLDPFDRLERHLRRLSQKNPNLTSAVRAKARVAGASDYLTKPFTQAELVKMVFRYLT